LEARPKRLHNRLPWAYNERSEVTEIHSLEQNQLHRL
jgi:hypothetical protein